MRICIGFSVVLAIAGPASAGAGQAAHSHPPMARVAAAKTVLPHGVYLKATAGFDGRGPSAIDPAAMCETAVTTAEAAHRLPPRLLGAISVTETGRIEPASSRIRPWPWTINAEGVGRFFATRQAAIAAVKALLARGVQSVDVGCLQVNLAYHRDAFATLDAAFDPQSNADYAARFLNALYASSKNWPAAVAAYHSETPALGNPYRVLVMARWQGTAPYAAVTGHAAYGDFTEVGKAYDVKAYDHQAYRAFLPPSRVYGAFAPR